MKRKTALTLGATVALAVCAAFFVLRVAQVNAATPAPEVHRFALGEEATYSGNDSSGGTVNPGDITVTAEHAALLNREELAKLPGIPAGYVDDLMASTSANDMRALVVEVTLRNTTSEPREAHVQGFKARSGAWSNGLFAEIYFMLNDGLSTRVPLEPGGTEKATLISLLYDNQSNSTDAWQHVDERTFDLVLTVYPQQYVINLGQPGLNSAPSLGEEA
ncbi:MULTISPECIES: hypothetical protein [Gordonibacter]|uniref:Uncharacterized protein n=1 Tax=Gordonibacter faecis TaxID=3047475 RepID=A0ABT7DP22_9ACTN|nr:MULTISPECIES: hypothetical protein [unclassified Gordonibacter]MDJ1651299.1 hypothetical protein [Gordonibacter sp. KGMB12511]HIW76295.1 hypothetical protein [Candidatus Gordonibacter avicola]